MNFLDGRGRRRTAAPPVVQLSGGAFPLDERRRRALAGEQLTLGIRAEAIGVEHGRRPRGPVERR